MPGSTTTSPSGTVWIRSISSSRPGSSPGWPPTASRSPRSRQVSTTSSATSTAQPCRGCSSWEAPSEEEAELAVIQAPPLARPEPVGRRLLVWLTTPDHKKIGILYLINSLGFLVVGGILALLMRTELARPGTQFLSLHAYNQVFTEHGTLMIFLFIFPTLAGFGNYFVPLQIGALDMAFPRVNALSFWLLPVGGLTIVSGFVAKGGAAAGGWTSFAPLSEQLGTGEDLWIAGLLLVGAASILGAINFIVTILRMRAPGMSMMRMPIFCWSTLATSLLVVLATPVITAGLVMLFAERHLGAV